jgi:threonyl-tRNA synthetase
LRKENIRVSVDTSADSLNKKIRNAELMKVPYILIVGEKEVNSNGVSVRVFKTKEQYEQSEAEFIKTAVEKRDTRAL